MQEIGVDVSSVETFEVGGKIGLEAVIVGEDLVAANVHVLEDLLNALREVHRSYFSFLGDCERQGVLFLWILLLSAEVSFSKDLANAMQWFHLELP